MEFTYRTENKNAAITLTERSSGEGIVLLDIDMQFDEPVIPKPVLVEWKTDCLDSYCVWGPEEYYARNFGPEWKKRITRSCLANGEPVQQIISAGGRNRLTIALSDAAIPTEIATGVLEREAKFQCQVQFFMDQINYIEAYHATIYIDMTDRTYTDALRAVHDFWSSCGYTDAYIPDAARRPMYSTWYAFHGNLTADKVIEQCRLAVKLGMRSVLVDDGWQESLGDWNVNTQKFPDMKVFVDEIHAIGMKVLLWFSMPFLEKRAKCYECFADKVLNPKEGFHLDPRHPQVRRHLVDVYTNAVKDWSLDGLKLDYIDFFHYYPDTPEYDKRWDTPSIHEAVDMLMQEITESIRAVNPEVMIEFRQPYYGPTICKYASMIRIGDCPNDGIENHVRGIMLRQALAHTPVHSDMLMWNVRDTVENAARQVIATLFFVPQISILLDKIPKEHKQMLNFYLNFWNENRETLLDGVLEAENPEALFTMVSVEKDGHIIAAAHSKTLLKREAFKRLHYINATGETELYLRVMKDCGTLPCTVYNCTGKIIWQGEQNIVAGLHEFEVPESGMVVLGA